MDIEFPALTEITDACAALKPLGVCDTPLLKLYEQGTLRVFAKLESLQRGARCCKVRGAFNAIAKMRKSRPGALELLRQSGIITASAGNFAIALGQVTQTLDIPLTVLVPTGASTAKLGVLKVLAPQAEVVEVTSEDWWQSMLQERIVGWAAVAGKVPPGLFISPAQDMAVMEGNGTIGLEILQQLDGSKHRELHVIAPYGGGGLSIGVACAVKGSNDNGRRASRIYACEVSTGAPFYASLAAGKPVAVEHTATFVDGIGAKGVLPDNFRRAQKILDGSFVVSPADIMTACCTDTWGPGQYRGYTARSGWRRGLDGGMRWPASRTGSILPAYTAAYLGRALRRSS